MQRAQPRKDPAPGSLEALRESNRARVVAALRDGSASRAEIARRTGLSRSTVGTVVADLLATGAASEGPQHAPGRGGAGRPSVPISLKPAAGMALGIDLSHDGVRVVLSDLGHRALDEWWEETPNADATDPDEVLAMAADVVRARLAVLGMSAADVAGAACAVPSPIDPHTGVLGNESCIPCLAHVDVGSRLTALLGIAVAAENDANLCALAEHRWGVAPGYRNVVYAKFSRGIGAGLLLDGILYRGRHGSAGELGHTPVIPEGPLCRCGNRGCLEVLAGTEAVLDLVANHYSGPPTIQSVVTAANAGDTVCRRAFRDVGTLVGTALAAATNLLNPDIIVIGGELVDAWPLMEASVREALDRAAIHRSAADVVISPSTLGRRGEAMGAVSLAVDRAMDGLAIAS
ncbi:MAG: ROK family protein [Thermoleophilia bacterium]